jgi:hypothetical protein
MLNIVAVLLSLTAVFAYLNHKYLNWPMTIGVMTIALGRVSHRRRPRLVGFCKTARAGTRLAHVDRFHRTGDAGDAVFSVLRWGSKST